MLFRFRLGSRILPTMACILALGVVVLTVWLVVREKEIPEHAVPIEQPADCTALLLRHGIAVQQPPLAMEQIHLPQQANSVYEAYLQLQDRQGLGLRNCFGKDAMLYLYEDATEDAAWITLIVCEGQLVAADITDETQIPSALF